MYAPHVSGASTCNGRENNDLKVEQFGQLFRPGITTELYHNSTLTCTKSEPHAHNSRFLYPQITKQCQSKEFEILFGQSRVEWIGLATIGGCGQIKPVVRVLLHKLNQLADDLCGFDILLINSDVDFRSVWMGLSDELLTS